MSAWYSISGTIRVRRCPEVDAIAAKIRAHCDRDFAVNLVPMNAEVDGFSIEGTGDCRRDQTGTRKSGEGETGE